MALKKYKAMTNGLRHMTSLDYAEITTDQPEKSLLVKLNKKSGRNNQGKITVRHQGGGAKRKYRIIDFKRNKDNIPGKVATIEYDPNRTANIALIHYADGEKRLGGIGDYLADQIMKKSGIECRVTTLGHVQRGARPTANDRILASAFGVHAVDLLARGKFNRMVAWQNRGVVDVAIDEAINTYKVVDQNEGLIDTAFALGIYIGTT